MSYVLLIATAGATAIGYVCGSKETERRLLKKKAKTQAKKEEPAPKRSAVQIMKRLHDNQELFREFTVVESHKGKSKYHYREEDWLFSVQFEKGKYLAFQVLKGEEAFLQYRYVYEGPQRVAMVQQKDIKRSLFAHHDTRSAMEVIDEFLDLITRSPKYWGFLGDQTVIIDDVVPEEKTNRAPTKEELDASPVDDHICSLQKLIGDKSLPLHADILALYEDILQKMNECLLAIDDLDDEARHNVEYLIRQDIETLFLSYQKLSEKSQEEVLGDVLEALGVVQRKTDKIRALLEEKNKFEVEKQVQIIRMRH